MNIRMSILMLGALFLLAGSVFAEDMKTEQETVTEAKEVGNKICPTEGAKIGSMGEGVKVEHEGKIYNLCCADCIKIFKENPEKYHKIADKEVGLEIEESEDHEDHEDHDHGEEDTKESNPSEHENHDHK